MFAVLLATLLSLYSSPAPTALPVVSQEEFNLTGAWQGEFKIPASYSSIPLYLVLNQAASAEIKGKGGGGPGQQYKFTKATLEGDKLHVEFETPEDYRFAFDLTCKADSLEGKAHIEWRTEKYDGTVNLKRVK